MFEYLLKIAPFATWGVSLSFLFCIILFHFSYRVRKKPTTEHFIAVVLSALGFLSGLRVIDVVASVNSSNIGDLNGLKNEIIVGSFALVWVSISSFLDILSKYSKKTLKTTEE